MLSIQQLTLQYQSNAPAILEEVNLTAASGEVVVLIGDNGVGKSTLLKAIAGSIAIKAGEISINHQSIRSKSRRELALQLAFVPTVVPYSSLLKVSEFISFGRYPFTNWLGAYTPEDNAVVEAVIRECALEKLANKRMNEISDGERQKVAIARALTQQTALILLDEPTTHLDIKNTIGILSLLKDQALQHGKTIVFSSHQIERSLAIADKVWLFNDRKVIGTDVETFKKSDQMNAIVFGGNDLA